jgi:hypothetical protein
VEWLPAGEYRDIWDEATFYDIPDAVLFKTYVAQMRRTGVFSTILEDLSESHDFRLLLRIERLEQRSISSPHDLELESFIHLAETRFGQVLWSGRFVVTVENRELGFGEEKMFYRHTTMARLAAVKLARETAVELNRFLTAGGITQLVHALSPDCPARTPIRLEVDGIPVIAEEALRKTVSDSPCYSVKTGDASTGERTPGLGLVVQASGNPSVTVTVAIGDSTETTMLYRTTWVPTSGKAEDGVPRDILEVITAYHHEDGICPHYRHSTEDRTARPGFYGR